MIELVALHDTEGQTVKPLAGTLGLEFLREALLLQVVPSQDRFDPVDAAGELAADFMT
jgi:hypothetical protein